MGPAAEFEAALLVQKLKQVREQIKQVEDLMQQVARDFDEYQILLSIPGFGPYVAAVVLAAIADALRFDSSHQVVKLAGYDLCANRSGKSSDDALPVISKNGNAQLRYALYQAAFIASVHNAHFSAYFTHVLRGRQRERGIKTKMRVKLAAKMLIIAWTLMKKKQPFNPDYLHRQ
jgi:transposase